VIRLYRAPFSTNVERVALALAHKGIEVESIWIDYGDRSPVERVSGQPLVPVLEFDDGAVVCDSMQIVRVLDGYQQLGDEHPRLTEWIARVDGRPRV
jgi:glutathione S-transferase